MSMKVLYKILVMQSRRWHSDGAQAQPDTPGVCAFRMGGLF